MIIYIDLDNTLCSPISSKIAKKEIKYCKPYKRMIKVINELYKRGHFIVIWTHRYEYCEKQTVIWLKKHKVKYNEIKFNKLGYDLLIDDKAFPPYNYLNANVIEGLIEKTHKWNFNKGKFNLKKENKK